MTRLPLLAALAGIIVVVAGLLLMSGGNPGPAPLPSPTGPATDGPPSIGPMPTAIQGGWVGASRGTAIEATDVTTLDFGVIPDTGPSIGFRMDRAGFSFGMQSSVASIGADAIRLVSKDINGGCSADDTGDYRWAVSSDRQWLTLTMITEACSTRGKILPGTWQYSLAHDSRGGAGIAAIFAPYFTMTLPPGSYVGSGYGQTDTLTVETPTYTFKLWKDLDGFVDPCDFDAGRINLEGMDGVLSYLREDPRFDVTREEEFTIDGRRAVEVEFRIGDAIEPPCWNLDGDPADKTGVLTWAPQAAGGSWNAPIGSDGALVVTEVDGVSLTFEPVITTGSAFEFDRATLDTIRFLDALPEPPAG